MAVIFELEHFDYYSYGRKVLIQTDRKPLIGLSKKAYDTVTPRLQKVLLKLNRYDTKLEYIPGKYLITVDALSRAPLAYNKFEINLEDENKS